MRLAPIIVCTSVLLSCAGQAPHAGDPHVVGTPLGSPAPPVSPPKSAHAKLLERLLGAPTRALSRRGISIPLPDADEWRDVDFWLVP